MNLEELVKRVLSQGEIKMEPWLVLEVYEAKLKAKQEREELVRLKKENEELKDAYIALATNYNDVLESNISLREELENVKKLLLL